MNTFLNIICNILPILMLVYIWCILPFDPFYTIVYSYIVFHIVHYNYSEPTDNWF